MLTTSSNNDNNPTTKETPLNFDSFEDGDNTSAKQQEANEDLLIENNKRFVLFPIQYNQIWSSYKDAEARFWTAEEVELSDDLDHWNTLPRKERSTLLMMLASFSALPFNLVKKLNADVQSAEARAYFGFQIMQCGIHAELFSVILDLFSNNANETIMQSEYLAETVVEMSSLCRKQAWIQAKITESGDTFANRLAALAIYYRVCLSTVGSITTLLSRDNVLPGLVKSVARVYRDWNTYSNFCISLIDHLKMKPSDALVRNLVAEACSIEMAFVDDLVELSGGYMFVSEAIVDPISLKSMAQHNGNCVLKSLNGTHIFTIADQGEFATGVDIDLEAEARKDEVEETELFSAAAKQNTNVPDMSERQFSISEDF